MHRMVSNILGLSPEDSKRTPTEWIRALLPLMAPLAICASGVRVELIWVALAWIVLLVPGLLAVNLFFPAPHPFSGIAARFGVATLLAMVPAACVGWMGCMLHWTLSTYMWTFGLVYVGLIAAIAHFLAHKKESESPDAPRWPSFDLGLNASKIIAAIVLICLGVVIVGVVMASPPSEEFQFKIRYDQYSRPGWWHGVVVGAVGSILGGLTLLVAGLRNRAAKIDESADEHGATAEDSGQTRNRGKGAKSRKSSESAQAPIALLGNWLSLLIWIAAACLTVHLMRVVYSESVPVPSKKASTLLWNVDDVAYVCEATDYLYGAEMGRFEPSIGSNVPMSRASMSPMMAPLVAMIAKFTGITPPALHHSVMPPLMILIGASCLVAVLSVIFRNDRWLVPLGLFVALLLIYKTWDHARCEVEMIAFRAMQSKGVHLIWVQPMQLAALLLLATRPGKLHLAFAFCTGIVAHTVHPFGTINAMVWSTAMVVGAILFDRKAVLYLLAMLVFSCGLAGLYYTVSKQPKDGPKLSSGREKGSRIQSRDVIRIDEELFTIYGDLEQQLQQSTLTDEVRGALWANNVGLPQDVILEPEADGVWAIMYGKRPLYRIKKIETKLVVYECEGTPIPQLDPFWSFGLTTLYTIGALAVPLLLGFGFRRREVFYVGWLGAAALLACNVEPLGHVLNKALPMSIFWRGRWMLPQLVSGAVLATMIYWSVCVLIRGRLEKMTPLISLVASIVTLAGVGGMLLKTSSMPLQVGDAPKNLTKFSDDLHGLVDLLGCVEANPFVFGPFLVHHELPQLMPNIQLVFSRDKFMRAADAEDFRDVALGVFNAMRQGRLDVTLFDQLCEMYPIDHVIIDRPVSSESGRRVRGQIAQVLASKGWVDVGYSGRYQVWRAPTAKAAAAENPADE
ncbi:MAG TPA: DUF6077 domain-containing protein [Phycisphaerae bacterium]|nr:DUF6077 domain-containing protein [Phycisphaerae bacterium]